MWLAVGLLGCDEASPETPTTVPAADCADAALSWENTGGPILIGWCAPCHAGSLDTADRQGAPPGVDFDTLEASRPFADRIVERAVTSLDMPLGGPLTDQDQLRLLDWIGCGMP